MARRRKRTARGGSLITALIIIAVISAVLIALYIKDNKANTSSSESSIAAVSVADSSFDEKIRVEVLDVGQGDSILITSDDRLFTLIDAGTAACKDRLLGYLDERGVQEIEYMVLTHPDADHIGSAAAVLEHCDVNNIVMPDCTKDTKTYKELIAAVSAEPGLNRIDGFAGNSFNMDDQKFAILAPNSKKYSDTNNYSVALMMTCFDTRFLFMGDVEAESEREMLQSGADLSAQWLKVAHHGSRTSTTEEFLSAVSPTYAVISCGAGNRYGHPHDEILQRLIGISVFRTDLLGNITFVSDGNVVLPRGA